MMRRKQIRYLAITPLELDSLDTFQVSLPRLRLPRHAIRVVSSQHGTVTALTFLYWDRYNFLPSRFSIIVSSSIFVIIVNMP